MKFLSNVIGLLLLLTFSGFSQAADQSAKKEFPGRDIYLGTEYIEMDAFKDQFDKVIVVDVRSIYEFETLRIKGAKNIPINSRKFVNDMQELRDSNKDAKIVVYCNGKTCMKSYKAASKAKARGITDVVAFDAGIMDWAKAHPDLAVLLGESPIDPSKLIAKSRFKEHLLAPEKFAEMVQKDNVAVLDVRDPIQRMGMGLFVGTERQANLDDDSINKHIVASIKNNKTMLIYDEAGKQVRWLMYRLEAAGVKDYKFMKGGTRSYFKSLKKHLNI